MEVAHDDDPIQSYSQMSKNRTMRSRLKYCYHNWSILVFLFDLKLHHLFYCKDIKLFWKRLKEWMISNLGYGFELTVCEIIFGILNSNNPDIRLLNFVILFRKWYIYKCKSTKKQIFFFEFLNILKNKVNIMTYIPLEDDLGIPPWLDMLHNALGN